MAIKRLSIDQVEQQPSTAPIWALNNSVNSDVRAMGDLVIGISKRNGTKVDMLFVDRTWLPVRLTDQIPRIQLLESAEFRSAVFNKLLVLISEEEAERISRKEGAALERKRLEALRAHVRQGGAARSITDSKVEIKSTAEIESDTRSEVVSTRSSEEGVAKKPGVSAAFKAWVDRAVEMKDTDLLNELRSRRISLREAKFLSKRLIKAGADATKSLKALAKAIAKKSA